MSKSDIVRKGSDREFIIKVYESILERTPSDLDIRVDNVIPVKSWLNGA